MENEPVEELADLIHEIWVRWMRYMFSKCSVPPGRAHWGQLIPQGLVDRWQRQMNTPYEELPEEEKESDREIALRILTLLEEKEVKGADVS